MLTRRYLTLERECSVRGFEREISAWIAFKYASAVESGHRFSVEQAQLHHELMAQLDDVRTRNRTRPFSASFTVLVNGDGPVADIERLLEVADASAA